MPQAYITASNALTQSALLTKCLQSFTYARAFSKSSRPSFAGRNPVSLAFGSSASSFASHFSVCSFSSRSALAGSSAASAAAESLSAPIALIRFRAQYKRMYAVPLAEAEGVTAGSKAAGLAFLLRAGLPSPPGFVLVADALRTLAEEHAFPLEEAAAAPLETLPLLS